MKEKMKAIITVGISASGKSTYAFEWESSGANRVRIERDIIRKNLVEKDGGVFSWAKWNWKREDEVTKLCNDEIKKAAKDRNDVIISDTNLSKKRRNELTTKLQSFGYEVELVDFPVTLEEAWKRDAARANGVGHSVIAKQYEQWLEYSGRKQYVPDTSKPKCILVDIDGTLAHMNGKRGAFEWDRVSVDDCDHAVKMLLEMVWLKYDPITEIIILSGRDGVCEKDTKLWLYHNGINYNRLIMRAPGDMRKDTIVKEEIFWRDIADNYNVQFVIDDRPVVCRMWRELGLKVLQVGNPHVEF